MPFTKPLLLLCLIALSSLAFAQPCTDQWVYPSICSGDTLTLIAPQCSNCSYSWTVPPLNGNNGPVAKYLFQNDPGQAHTYFSFYFLDVVITDSNQNCTYTYHSESYQSHVEEIDIIALDGTWSGSPAPQRYAITYYEDNSSGYVQSPTWQVTGGTIVQTQTGLNWMTWPFESRTDTIHVVWNSVGPWNLDLTMNTIDQRAGWPNFTFFNCNADYSEKVGPDATIYGDTLVCPQGDTLYYTVANATPFTLNWVVTGGTLLSGQGTDSVVIAWPANPTGTVQAFVTLNGIADSSTVQVSTEQYPNQFLGPDRIHCTPYASIFLDARDANGQLYTWNTGAITPTISVSPPGTYFVDVYDSVCGITSSDTLHYTILPVISPSLGPDTSICADTSLTLSTPTGFYNHWWSNLTSDSTLVVTQAGQYHLFAQDSNGCSRYDTINVGFTPDCVFPGDADYDGTANNFDVLAIGANFGETGPSRPLANLQWYGQMAPDWADSLGPNVNMKQVDTDGNALVNADDTLAIALNYGFTHSKAQGLQTTGVPLDIRAGFDSVLVGDTAVYHISLGDSATPADSVYGIAFTINYDTALTDTNGLLYTDFSNCWIAAPSNIMTFSFDRYPSPHADIALVRTDGQDTSGFGDLCRIGFVTIDNISGKRNTLTETFHVSISDILFIDKDMNFREAVGGSDSTIVVEEETNLASPMDEQKLQIYPLPGNESVFLHLPGGNLEQVLVYDLSGKLVLDQGLDGSPREQIGVKQLPPGTYFLQVRSREGNWFRGKMPLIR